MYSLVDYQTRQQVSPENFVFTGEQVPWEVEMDLEEVRRKINANYFRQAPPLVSKYLPFMPIDDYRSFTTLGEGGTPLIESRSLGKKLGVELFFKVEGSNPTGSFKDRGSAVEVSVAKEVGARAIAVASTGNMAASCACYAAAAGIPCFVFVPEGVPAAKLAQVIAYGGRIVQVKGTYNDAARLAQEVAAKLDFYLAGDYAFRVEGAKTAAYEVLDQLSFQAPDAVFVPLGCGTNLAAFAKGFREYREMGFSSSMPRMIGAQAAGAAPIVESFRKRAREVAPWKQVDTLASAIAIGDPVDGLKALDAIYQTDGDAFAVSDQEMTHAQYLLSKEEGLFVESSGGVALAAILKAFEEGRLNAKRVVCVLCGDGLKDTTTILKAALRPPTIEPSTEKFLALYEGDFFESKNVAFSERGEILFNQAPTEAEVKAKLNELFGSGYSDAVVAAIAKVACRFIAKGKSVSFADFQDIVQDVLEAGGAHERAILSVKDFSVNTGKDQQSSARVEVCIRGEERSGEASGVGPVDAVINALKLTCNDQIDFTLKGYKVSIRDQGTDAVVYVEIKLERDGEASLGAGASPDIIDASIEAFERAYNGFI